MCCLFGIYDYGHKLSRKEKTKMLSLLSVACEDRGTDATGISYPKGDGIAIYKRPLPAHLLWFRLPEDCPVVMGHTRMTTQGSELKNWNNHPFPGKAGDTVFALAHNGVLHNDKILRTEQELPETKIETDSYIAVQLLEKAGEITMESLKDMAEKLAGSFTITVLTQEGSLYFVRGDNPMCIYHYPEKGFYIYASTEAILKKALGWMKLKLGKSKPVKMESGQILQLTPDGKTVWGEFDDTSLYFVPRRSWFGASVYPYWSSNDYLADLKAVASSMGIFPEAVDELLEAGFTTEEIEEYLYAGAM